MDQAGNLKRQTGKIRSRQLGIFLTLLATVIYILAFLLLHSRLGLGIASLATLPVIAAGWYLGLWPGLLTGLLIIPLDTLLYNLVGMQGWTVVFQGAGGAALVIVVLLGALVGQLRDSSKQLKRELEDRQKAEQALFESETRFRILSERALAGIYIVQADKFRYVNPALAEIFGYQPQEIIDRLGPEDLTYSEDRDIVNRQISKRLQGDQESAHYSFRGLRKDGSILYCEVLGRRLDYNGESAIIGTLLDISERKQAEARLQLQSTVLEAAANGIVITDQQGRIVWANPAITKMTGYNLDEILGQNPRMFKSGRQAKEFYRELWQTVLAGKVWQGELINQRKNGSSYIEEQTITPVHDQQGQISHFVAIKQDVSKRHETEEHIRELYLELEKRLSRLTALRQIDTAITSSVDLYLTLDVVLDQIISELKIDAANILLYKPQTQTLEYVVNKGFFTDALRHTHVHLGEGQAGKAALEKQNIHLNNLDNLTTVFPESVHLKEEGFVAYWAVPLIAKGQVRGVLELFHRSTFEPDDDWQDFLEALAGQTAIAIADAVLFEDLQQSNSKLQLAYDTTIEGWSRALDLRDQETEGHSRRVTEMTVRLARHMGMSEDELVHVRRGALLHDMGKMGVPDSILLKPGKLTEQEWEVMKKHTTYAFELLSPISFLKPALDIPYCHHEKWDGSGYPRGLAAEQIPLAARVFAIADVYDALSSDRPYRKAWPQEKTLAYIKEQSGRHFDPMVVEAFEKVMGWER